MKQPKPRPEVCLSPSTLDPWLQRNERKSSRRRPSFVLEHAPEILVVATIAVVLIVAGLAQ